MVLTRGLLSGAVQGLILREAKVARVERLGPRFRRLVLAGAALRDLQWTPGDKLQVLTRSLRSRTYTPTRWDAASGETELIAFLHGDSPGARWARDAEPGERVRFFGPRPSLELQAGPQALVTGDETSLGLALASGAGARVVLEATDLGELREVLDALRLEATLVPRAPGDAHLAALAEAVAAALSPTSTLVLSGRAEAIRQLRRRLKARDALPRRIQTRAYWAPGKTGLD